MNRMRAAVAQQVSLSKILNPHIAPEGPAMSWRLVQGVPCLPGDSWDWFQQQTNPTKKGLSSHRR